MSSGKLLAEEVAPGIIRFTISNPTRRGALDSTILDTFTATMPTLDARCVIITGEDNSFSSGYDISSLSEEVFAEEAERLVAHPFTEAIDAIHEYPYPTLAALNGYALGGGLELALACDLRLAATTAVLGMPPAKLGLIYSHTGIRKFIDTIGAARTRELILVGRNIDATTASAWGLVNAVCEPELLPDRAVEWAREITAGAPLAHRGNKRVIAAVLDAEGTLPARLERELMELRRTCFASEDFREGVLAFVEKRRPQWRGQ